MGRATGWKGSVGCGLGVKKDPRLDRGSFFVKCPGEDSNLHGILLPPRPQRGASANSATRARVLGG